MYLFSISLLSLLSFTISTVRERETKYFGYIVRESEQLVSGTNEVLKFKKLIMVINN